MRKRDGEPFASPRRPPSVLLCIATRHMVRLDMRGTANVPARDSLLQLPSASQHASRGADVHSAPGPIDAVVCGDSLPAASYVQDNSEQHLQTAAHDPSSQVPSLKLSLRDRLRRARRRLIRSSMQL